METRSLKKIPIEIVLILINVLFGMFLIARGYGDSVKTVFLPISIVIQIVVAFVIFRLDHNRTMLFTAVTIITLIGYMLQSLLINQGLLDKNFFGLVFFFIIAIVLLPVGYIAMKWLLGPGNNAKVTLFVLCGLVAANILILLSLFLLGRNIAGSDARLALSIGKFSVQPLEFIKVILVMMYSVLFTKYRFKDIEKIAIIAVVTIINGCAIVLLGETGTAILIAVISAVYCALFVENKLYLTLLLVLVLLMGLLTGLVIDDTHKSVMAERERIIQEATDKGIQGEELEKKLDEYMKSLNKLEQKALDNYDRIHTALDHNYDTEKSGYQVNAALKAICNGGLFGADNYKVSIPVPGSDFIFVVLIQNCGYIFAVIVLLLYLVILRYGFKIACKPNLPMLYKALAIGCSITIFAETFIMICGSTGMAPMTGIPLAFMSYGGMNLLSVFFMLSILLYTPRKEYINSSEIISSRGDEL